MTWKEQKRRQRGEQTAMKLRNIAILDFETDPFDNVGQEKIYPFIAVLYSDEFETMVIWDDDHKIFIRRVIAAIEAIPGEFTIYAHNGGKFDYMFLINQLRGQVSFKGRGIMLAKIGRHELRDSFHLIPEGLANWQKDSFDYIKLKRANREKYKEEIIRYCTNDCRYLLDIIKHFTGQFGLKLSIGQAAMAELRKHYKVAHMKANDDAFLRFYFYGGRVECLAGKGYFKLPRGRQYKLYDVNSMYPYVMATRQHPIGPIYTPRRGPPNEHTIFIDMECVNRGALICRTDDGEVTTSVRRGRFKTTIWEYETALKYNLIDRVKINWCLDCPQRSDFADFVEPIYLNKKIAAERMKQLQEGTPEYNATKKDFMMYKYLQNTGYGKFAQNPRKFKEHYFTASGERPPNETYRCRAHQLQKEDDCEMCARYAWGDMPSVRCDTHYVWSRAAPGLHFNNVGTAASITGAARAVLMEAIQHAKNAIYCDTDSLICEELTNTELHDSILGAWKLERSLDEVLIAGKKLYSYRVHGIEDGHKGREKIRSKGTADLSWKDLEAMLADENVIIMKTNKAPTLTRDGGQHYITRGIRATAKAKHWEAI